MELHEFLEQHKEDFDQGIIKEEYVGEIFDFLIEMANSDINAVKSYLNILYIHLLKYQYQPVKQSKSWINSIRYSSRQLTWFLSTKSLRNKISKDTQQFVYEKSIRDAVRETGLLSDIFPEYLPDEFSLDNLLDDDFIDQYLIKYAHTFQAKKALNIR